MMLCTGSPGHTERPPVYLSMMPRPVKRNGGEPGCWRADTAYPTSNSCTVTVNDTPDGALSLTHFSAMSSASSRAIIGTIQDNLLGSCDDCSVPFSSRRGGSRPVDRLAGAAAP